MKILVLAHRLPYPPNKGEKIRSFHQLEYLASLGHDVEVFAPIESAEDPQNSKAFSQLSSHFSCQLFPIQHKPIRLLLGLLKGEALSVANFYSSQMLDEIEKRLSVGDIDVVLLTSSAMIKYVGESPFLKKQPHAISRPTLLMDFMDLDSDKWRQYSQKSLLPMRWLYSREQRLIGQAEQLSQQLCDTCYLIADAEVDMYKQAHGKADNVVVMGNGLDTKSFYPSPIARKSSDDAPVFIFTGVMDYKPNCDAVMWFVEQCWSDILKKYSNARFIIAGMNPTKDIKQLTSQKGIEVTGFVDDILPFYHEADYFVAPFRIARGVQNKVLQAFACGLPVITTSMGAEGINCEHNHDVIIANSPSEVLQAVDKLQTNLDFKQALVTNAKKLIDDHFSWHSKLEPLAQALAQSLTQKKTPSEFKETVSHD